MRLGLRLLQRTGFHMRLGLVISHEDWVRAHLYTYGYAKLVTSF